MNAKTSRYLVVLFVMSMLCVTNAIAQEKFPEQEQAAAAPPAARADNQLAITRAEVNFALSQLTITGLNFGHALPTVELEGVRLNVLSSVPTQVVAALLPGLQPGSYLLTVSTGRGPHDNDAFHVTIGTVGPRGEAGPQGAPGPQGADGATGPVGPQGAPGAIGARGEVGPAGPQGIQGARGAQGDTGPAGLQGTPGVQGLPGPQGAQGETGAAGAQGARGLNWQGAWDSAANYVTDDAVSYLGSSWRALRANTNIAPVEGAEWTIVAQKGADGEAGSGGGGTVTSVSATGPLTVTNGATTPQISLSGVIPVENGGTGSATQNFVDLTTAQTIGGDKTFSAALSGNTVNAATQFNLGGNRVLAVSGVGFGSQTGANTFAGIGAGTANTSGEFNSFFGGLAGNQTISGYYNSSFGSHAGRENTTGEGNSSFGYTAGLSNQTGRYNSFFGFQAGFSTRGSDNTFVGTNAGNFNVGGSNNTILGSYADVSNATQNLTYATAIGSGAVVSTNNTVVLGRSADTVRIPGALSVTGALNFGTLSGSTINTTTQFNIGGNRVLSAPGSLNVFAGVNAGAANTTGASNTFVGASAGLANQTGTNNAFFGADAGRSNVADGNSFFGRSAGFDNTTGTNNAFFGLDAGRLNTTGNNNSFVGMGAGRANTTGSSNSFFGWNAGYDNSTGRFNAFFGLEAGRKNTEGVSNAFLGFRAGHENTLGESNTFVGTDAGYNNSTGDNNTIIGKDADVGVGDLNYATAVGAGAVVSSSNTIQLGRANGSDRVVITGQVAASGGLALTGSRLRLSPLATDDNHSIIYNSAINGIQFNAFDDFRWFNVRNNRSNMRLFTDGDLAIEGSYQQFSDARYKTNVQTFGNALDTIRRLRGVTYNWKPELNKNQQTQIGFIAQEVEAVLPELVSTDEQGYKSVSYSNAVPVLVEAVKEQQQQIDELKAIKAENAELRTQLDQLKQLVCSANPTAPLCHK